jgi:hypothetical protein
MENTVREDRNRHLGELATMLYGSLIRTVRNSVASNTDVSRQYLSLNAVVVLVKKHCVSEMSKRNCNLWGKHHRCLQRIK